MEQLTDKIGVFGKFDRIFFSRIDGFRLVWCNILGLNKISSSKEIMRGSWDEIIVHLINAVNKLRMRKLTQVT